MRRFHSSGEFIVDVQDNHGVVGDGGEGGGNKENRKMVTGVEIR